MTVYQVMPPLSDGDYAALKADIAERGVLVPVEYDDAGNVLDGHHRLKACAELGITEWPRIVRSGLAADEKRRHARQLNLARRHLDRAQKRELIAAQIKETPEKSNRQIAEDLKTSHPTVIDVRRDLEKKGDVERFTTSTDKRGRQQPAHKPAKSVSIAADEPKKPAKSGGHRRVVLDADFQAEADAAARDLEIERDERIALSGGAELAEENAKLVRQTSMLSRRVAGLLEEVGSLKQQAKTWRERALAAGWKERKNA